MMEKPACWGRLAVLSPSPDPQLQLQLIHNCFLLYKTHSLPGNENYYVCDVLNFVSPINMCLTNMCYHIYTAFSSVHNTLSIMKPVWCSSSSKTCELVTCKFVHFSKISMPKNSNSIRYIHHLHWISSTLFFLCCKKVIYTLLNSISCWLWQKKIVNFAILLNNQCLSTYVILLISLFFREVFFTFSRVI